MVPLNNFQICPSKQNEITNQKFSLQKTMKLQYSTWKNLDESLECWPKREALPLHRPYIALHFLDSNDWNSGFGFLLKSKKSCSHWLYSFFLIFLSFLNCYCCKFATLVPNIGSPALTCVCLVFCWLTPTWEAHGYERAEHNWREAALAK